NAHALEGLRIVRHPRQVLRNESALKSECLQHSHFLNGCIAPGVLVWHGCLRVDDQGTKLDISIFVELYVYTFPALSPARGAPATLEFGSVNFLVFLYS